mgnify:CR=1 FL=1
MTKEQIDVIVEMYKEDTSYSKMSKRLGVSEHVVKHWVRNNRSEYALTRRRNLAEKTGSLSTSLWLDSKWNIERGVEMLKQKWGAKQ